MVWPQWKTVTSFLTTLNRIIKWPRNSTPRYLRKRAENRCLNNTRMNAHSSTGYSSQKEQTTQVSTGGRTDRQSAVCPHDGMLFSFMSLFVKRSEVLAQVAAQTKPEHMTLRQASCRRTNPGRVHSHQESRAVKFRTERRAEVITGRVEGKRGNPA